LLAEQRIGEDWQIVGLIAAEFASGSRLVLSRSEILEPEIDVGEPYADRRILWRTKNGIFQLDNGCLEITCCNVLLGIFDGGRRLFRVHWEDKHVQSGGKNQSGQRTTAQSLEHRLSSLWQNVTRSRVNLGTLQQIAKRSPHLARGPSQSTWAADGRKTDA
jgi:hypothetical protein